MAFAHAGKLPPQAPFQVTKTTFGLQSPATQHSDREPFCHLDEEALHQYQQAVVVPT